MNLIALIKERAKYYKCLACSQALSNCEVNVLSQNDNHCTVEVTCGNCGVSFVAVLLLRRPKHPDGVPKDLEEPISGDELLDVHRMLTQHSGRLDQLFRSRSR